MPEDMDKLLQRLKNFSIEEYYAGFEIVENWLWDKENQLLPKTEHRDEIVEFCGWLLEGMASYPVWMRIHLLSFCMKCREEREYARMLMREILEADYEEIGEYSQHYLFWQMTNAVFSNTKLQSVNIEKDIVRLYKKLYETFYEALHVEQYKYIPVEKRDKDRVFVFISQMQGEYHAPTKTLCDRCYVLQKYLKKKVLIINTAMVLTKKGDAPFYNRVRGGYNPDYLKKNALEFRGEIFELFQCEDNMPDVGTIVSLLRKVAKEKPYCIINIGGSDLCIDLCGNIVPEITVSTVFSEVAITCGTFQIVCNDLKEKEYELLELMQCRPCNIKKALFTFVFKEQKNHYSRQELGLLEEARIILVTGWRLDQEIDETFLCMLNSLFEEEPLLEVVFMGLFEDCELRLNAYPGLKERSRYLKYQEDALAVTECCDIYVNPKRNGGGSSAAEALYKGLPVVTLPTGDVSAAAGADFRVENYDAMADKIKSYCRNHSYYNEMSLKAKERAAALMDSKTSFCEVFAQIEQSPDFY